MGARESLFEKRDITEHDRKQIVEVMRHARCELADRLEALQLPQRRLYPLPLLNLRDELSVRRSQFVGALLDPCFQGLIQATQRGLSVPRVGFAFVQCFQTRARFVLSPATT